MIPVEKKRIVFLLKFIPLLALLIDGFALSCDGSPHTMRAPREKAVTIVRTASMETSPVRPFFLNAITFFQKKISPLDGPRCVLYPTCSHYGYQAIEKFGVLKGIMMTGDRLIRCNPSRKAGHDYPLLPNGRLYDPLARNVL